MTCRRHPLLENEMEKISPTFRDNIAQTFLAKDSEFDHTVIGLCEGSGELCVLRSPAKGRGGEGRGRRKETELKENKGS